MPQTTELIHANAGRLLGEMLGSLQARLEAEGDVIGPYILCERLGEGGFGNVWRAQQVQPIRREVAVKVIKLGMDTMQVLARFEQERQALASMRHPCIASMIDAGVSPAGRPYFAMELVRGDPITRWCQEHRSSLRDRLGIFIQTCQAVEHAHQRGIIHRDLKPSNILVSEIDGLSVPKIIDFGIAKAIRSNDGEGDTLLTYAEQLLGTPRYMSPEQLAGMAVIDTRSDIYSLGVLLYELLTDSPPFDVQVTEAELKRLVCECQPLRPSSQIRRRSESRSGDQAGAFDECSEDLDWITMRALEKDVARRYQTASELAADVQRFLDHEPIRARPPSLGYLTSRWIKRYRTAFAAACFVTLSLIGGTSLALWQAQSARLAQHHAEKVAVRAQHAEREAQKARQQAQQTAAYLTGLLDKISQEVSDGRNPEALKAALQSSDQEILQLHVEPDLRIWLLDKIEAIYSSIGETKLAIPLAFSKAREVARKHGVESDEAFEAELNALNLVIDFGARATGPQLLENLQRKIEAAGGRGGKLWLEVQRHISRCWIKLDMPAEALQAAETLIQQTHVQNFPPEERVVHQIAHSAALEFSGRFEEAIALLEEAQRNARVQAHSDRIANAFIYLFKRQGDFKRGVAFLTQQLTEQTQRHGNQSRLLIPTLFKLGEFESRLGNHALAISHTEHALELARQPLPKDGRARQKQHREIWQALRELADRQNESGRCTEAITTAQQALKLAEQMENETLIINSLRLVADHHYEGGELELAYSFKRQCYHLIRSNSANLRDAEQDFMDMCHIRLEQSRPQEALQMGVELWSEIQARPDSSQDVAHVAEVASFMLNCHEIVKAVQPLTPEPKAYPSWRAAAGSRWKGNGMNSTP